MSRQRYIKLKCTKCGHVSKFGEFSLDITSNFTCPVCKTRINKKAFDELKEKIYSLDSSDFCVEICTEAKFSLSDIFLTAQDKALDAISDALNQPDAFNRPVPQMLKSPEIMHTFYLTLVNESLCEYHRQLRAALHEKGIELENFEEIPLLPREKE